MQLESNAERVTPCLRVDLQLLPSFPRWQTIAPEPEVYEGSVVPAWSCGSRWWRRQTAVCVDGLWCTAAGLAMAGACCKRI